MKELGLLGGVVIVGAALGLVYVYQSKFARGPGRNPASSRLAGPEGEALATAVARCDFSGLARLLTSTRQTMSWDDRGFYLELVREAFESVSRAAMDAWAEQQPNDPGVWLARGVHAVVWAWQARGGGVASNVSGEDFKLFAERLRLADSDFARCAALDPADPTPHAYRIACAMGLRHGTTVAFTHLASALERDPENYLACRFTLTFLHPKWHGTEDELRRAALEIARRARPGSDLHAMILVAHLQVWEYRAIMKEQRAAADAALNEPHVRSEMEAAYASVFGSAAHRPRRSTIHLRNYAALWFHLVRDQRLFAELSAIGPAHTDFPWAFIGHGNSLEECATSGFALASSSRSSAASNSVRS